MAMQMQIGDAKTGLAAERDVAEPRSGSPATAHLQCLARRHGPQLVASAEPRPGSSAAATNADQSPEGTQTPRGTAMPMVLLDMGGAAEPRPGSSAPAHTLRPELAYTPGRTNASVSLTHPKGSSMAMQMQTGEARTDLTAKSDVAEPRSGSPATAHIRCLRTLARRDVLQLVADAEPRPGSSAATANADQVPEDTKMPQGTAVPMDLLDGSSSSMLNQETSAEPRPGSSATATAAREVEPSTLLCEKLAPALLTHPKGSSMAAQDHGTDQEQHQVSPTPGLSGAAEPRSGSSATAPVSVTRDDAILHIVTAEQHSGPTAMPSGDAKQPRGAQVPRSAPDPRLPKRFSLHGADSEGESEPEPRETHNRVELLETRVEQLEAIILDLTTGRAAFAPTPAEAGSEGSPKADAERLDIDGAEVAALRRQIWAQQEMIEQQRCTIDKLQSTIQCQQRRIQDLTASEQSRQCERQPMPRCSSSSPPRDAVRAGERRTRSCSPRNFDAAVGQDRQRAPPPPVPNADHLDGRCSRGRHLRSDSGPFLFGTVPIASGRGYSASPIWTRTPSPLVGVRRGGLPSR